MVLLWTLFPKQFGHFPAGTNVMLQDGQGGTLLPAFRWASETVAQHLQLGQRNCAT